MLDLLNSYAWPTDGYPIATVSVRVGSLATRLGIALQTWDEDGLGPACGFGFRVSSGRVYLLKELEHTVRYHGASGPAIFVDATDLAFQGADSLVQEVKATLGLSPAEVTIIDDATLRENAGKLVAQVEAQKRLK